MCSSSTGCVGGVAVIALCTYHCAALVVVAAAEKQALHAEQQQQQQQHKVCGGWCDRGEQ
jgi:hypothetical protein